MIGVSDKSITKIQQLLQNAVNEAIKWFGQNKLTLNINKCNVFIISNKNIVDSIDIFINGVKLPFVKSAEYLGVEIDSKLSWSNHIDGLCKKLSSQLYILRRLKQILPTDDINCVYYGIFQSIIDYCITVWGSAAQKYLCKIQKLQNRAARLLAQNFDWNIRGIDIVRGLGWQNGKEKYSFLSCCLTYKSLNDLAPYYLSDLFSSVSEYHTVSTRNATSNTLQQPRCNNYLYKSSLSVDGSRLWNKLPLEIRNKKTFSAFKYNLKQYIAINQTLTQL